MKKISVLCALALLTACKAQVSTDIFAADFADPGEGGAPSTPVVIGIEASTEEKCKDLSGSMLAAIQKQIDSAEFIGCERLEFTTYARFRMQAPVIAAGDNAGFNGPVAVGWATEGEWTTLSLHRNSEAIEAIWAGLPLSPNLAPFFITTLASPSLFAWMTSLLMVSRSKAPPNGLWNAEAKSKLLRRM